MTEADRELLTLAAQAAGIRLVFGTSLGELVCGYPDSYPDRQLDGCTWVRHWNPLDDDGDAFRLQVHVGMIVNAPTAPSAHAGGHAEARYFDIVITESCAGHDDESRRAATRRAIVRCAAETITRKPA